MITSIVPIATAILSYILVYIGRKLYSSKLTQYEAEEDASMATCDFNANKEEAQEKLIK